MDEPAEVLAGGVANADAVIRIGDTVRRPLREHASAVHALLSHLAAVGFAGAPRLLGVDEQGREMLAFLPGRVPISPYPAWSMSVAVLDSVAGLLRRFHDAQDGFVAPADAAWSTELADPSGSSEVICHNDVCPDNLVFDDRRDEAVAMIDFDFAAPGRTLWDVARTARQLGPLYAPTFRRGYPAGLDAVTRAARVARGYGVAPDQADELVEAIEETARRGVEFVRRHVDAGHPAFIRMWESTGGWAAREADAEWLAQVAPSLRAAIAGR